ncbi:MAG TPA: tyrosine-type recombinase/integrase [Candidatus Cybelea sp.]|nr:tyrosine-type recombinase/integrase [Candidatus Cybelea sp.]
MRGHFTRKTYTDKTGKLKKMSTWSVCYDAPHEPGEPRKRRVKSGFRTKKEATEWFTRKAEELRQGIAPTDDRITVEQYLRQWLESIADSISSSALHAYRNHVMVHIIPALGKVRLTELRPEHIERAKVKWAASAPKRRKKETVCAPLSARTVRHIYETLNVALNRAKRQRRIIVNPCELMDPPRVEQKEMRALDSAGAAALLKACEQSIIGAAIVTSLGTGLRRGELLALRWGDVDLEAGLLTVQRAIERVDRCSRFKDPKTKRSRRTISLPRFVRDRLHRHYVEQGERLLHDGFGRPTPLTLIFERGGEAWVPNTFNTAFTRMLRAAGVPHIRLHDLRHTFASMALDAGVDLKTVSNALGHSTISTTADIYAHVTDALMRDAAERIDGAVSAALSKSSKAS